MAHDASMPMAGHLDEVAPRSSALDRADPLVPVPRNPAEVLAQLMDFSGSVALAELLHAPAPQGGAHPEAGRLAAELQDRVHAHLDVALAHALGPLTGPRAPRLPEPIELLQALAQAGGGAALDEQAATRLARELGAPLRAAFAASLRQLHVQFATLRAQIAPELRALGSRAARLERIDTAFQRSIQRKLGELFERLELAAQCSFARACAQACAALGERFGVSELSDWAADGGWFESERARCEHMLRALFARLRGSLEGLLSAAGAAEVP
jgi:hypothetical protein